MMSILERRLRSGTSCAVQFAGEKVTCGERRIVASIRQGFDTCC